MAPLFVTGTIEWRQHVLAESGAFLEDRADHVRAGIADAQLGITAMEIEDVIDQKAHVAQRGFVLGHGGFLR
ncbi:hypothetical protein D3C72_2091810 [compost metagenome]